MKQSNEKNRENNYSHDSYIIVCLVIVFQVIGFLDRTVRSRKSGGNQYVMTAFPLFLILA
jgi:hypothetical protein